MSFGFSIGDFITIVQLASNVVSGARNACGAHDELTREVTSLYIVLRQLQREIAKPNSILKSDHTERKAELATLIEHCYRVLKVLDGILKKYNGLPDDKRRITKFWKKVQFGNGEMQDLSKIRLELSTHTNVITMFLNLSTVGSLGKVEEHMISHGEELKAVRRSVNWVTASMQVNAGRGEGSILTSYANDDKAFWKEFRRELVKEGYSSSVLRKHKNLIRAYVKELGDRGALDEVSRNDTTIEEEQEFASDDTNSDEVSSPSETSPKVPLVSRPRHTRTTPKVAQTNVTPKPYDRAAAAEHTEDPSSSIDSRDESDRSQICDETFCRNNLPGDREEPVKARRTVPDPIGQQLITGTEIIEALEGSQRREDIRKIDVVMKKPAPNIDEARSIEGGSAGDISEINTDPYPNDKTSDDSSTHNCNDPVDQVPRGRMTVSNDDAFEGASVRATISKCSDDRTRTGSPISLEHEDGEGDSSAHESDIECDEPNNNDKEASPPSTLATIFVPELSPGAYECFVDDELEAILHTFRTFLALCLEFVDNLPMSPQKQESEFKKLSETILSRVLLKLDAVETYNNPSIKARRRESVQRVQYILDQLDGAHRKGETHQVHAFRTYLKQAIQGKLDLYHSPRTISTPGIEKWRDVAELYIIIAREQTSFGCVSERTLQMFNNCPRSARSIATEADARKHRIPPNYSLKSWDPAREPIILFNSVMDAETIGKWTYDWTVYFHGTASPAADIAADLWLLLIELSFTVQVSEDCIHRVRLKENREMLEDFIEAGERLGDKLNNILRKCENPDRLLVLGPKFNRQFKLTQEGEIDMESFVSTLILTSSPSTSTDKWIQSTRLWLLRFEANCVDILRNPGKL